MCAPLASSAFFESWLLVALLAGAACGRTDPPPPDPTPPAVDRQPPSSIAAEMARAAGRVTPGPPRPGVDWSKLARDGWLVPQRHFQHEVDAAKTCLRASLLEKARCLELQRMLARNVTDGDVRATLAAVKPAVPALADVWRERFAAAGRTFAMPEIRFYGWTGDGFADVAPAPPDCPAPLDNAWLCVETNQIHYDLVFLTRLTRAVHDVDGTPGTFAAVAVVSHELGHAVDVQLGLTGLEEYAREAIADCFSGAAVGAVLRAAAGPSRARQVVETATPMTEGQLAMYLLGGPAMTDGDHPPGPVRASLFTRGFNLGAGECTLESVRPR
ncbi:MAG: hypothetical protein AB7H93_23950 [Vicinamibacterales bacterium]